MLVFGDFEENVFLKNGLFVGLRQFAEVQLVVQNPRSIPERVTAQLQDAAMLCQSASGQPFGQSQRGAQNVRSGRKDKARVFGAPHHLYEIGQGCVLVAPEILRVIAQINLPQEVVVVEDSLLFIPEERCPLGNLRSDHDRFIALLKKRIEQHLGKRGLTDSGRAGDDHNSAITQHLHRLGKDRALNEEGELLTDSLHLEFRLADFCVVKYSLDNFRAGQPELEILALDGGMPAQETIDILGSDDVHWGDEKRIQGLNNGIFVAGRKAYGRDDNIPGWLEQLNLR